MYNYVFLIGILIAQKIENKEMILTMSIWYDKDTKEVISVKVTDALADFIKGNIKVGQKIAIKGRLTGNKEIPVIAEKLITLGGSDKNEND